MLKSTAPPGSFNTFKNTFSAGTGLIKGKWSFDGRYSKITSKGYIDRASSDLDSYSFSGGYYGSKNLFKFTLFSGNEKTYQAWDGVPGYMLDTNRTYNGLGAYYDVNGNLQYYKNQTDNYKQNHYRLFWANRINSHWNINAALHYTYGSGYYEEYKTGQDLMNYGLEYPVIGGDTITNTDLVRQRWLDNDFYGLTFALNHDNQKNLKFTFGGSANLFSGRHFGNIIWSRVALNFDKDYQWYFNTGKKNEINLYAKLNYQLTEKLNLYADLQFRQIDYRLKGPDNDLRDISQTHYYSFVNPKLGLFYEFNAHNKAYLSGAVGNREPNRSSLVDANPERPYPVQESLYDAEAAYSFQSSRFMLDANFYYMYYHNQLVLTGKINDVGDPVMENVPQSYRAGLELSAGVKFSDKFNWNVNATFSSNKVLNFTEYVDNWDEWPQQIVNNLGTTDIAFSPWLTAGSVLNYEALKNLHLILYSKYVGKQYIDNTSSDERSLDPYFVNDLLIRYEMHPKFMKEINISLKVNNLFNTEYISNAWVYRYYSEGSYGVLDGYFPQAGTNFMVGIGVGF